MKKIKTIKTALIVVLTVLVVAFGTTTIILAINWNNPKAIADRNVEYIRKQLAKE